MQPTAATVRRVARPWIGPVARVGLASKGIVFLLIGALAVMAATGEGGRVAGEHGAVRTVGHQPYGDLLLVCLAIGLLAYALWRALEAVLDLEGTPGLKGIGRRIAFGISAALYGGLAVSAIQLARGEGAGGDQPSTWVARVLAQPFGDLLVVGAGTVLAGYGLFHLWDAITAHFERKLDLARMTRRQRVAALWIGRIGTAARGVVFGIIGYHLVLAGIHARPGETRDIGGALRTLAGRPHGHLILGVIAAGLFFYGVFTLVRSRVGRIPGSDG